MTPQKKGILYLIPTFLSENTVDQSVTPYLKKVVAETEYYLVENVRTARRFISALQIGITIDALDFKEVNKRTGTEEIDSLLEPLNKGKNVGLMSEAGCPAVADPGSQVVEAAHKSDIKVVPLVGPSSILLALMASGFSGQSFAFHGYLPIDDHKKRKRLVSLEKRSLEFQETQIFMETPFRNKQLFKAILQHCNPETRLSIAKNLTADNEWISTKKIRDWKLEEPDLHKAPVIFSLSNP